MTDRCAWWRLRRHRWRTVRTGPPIVPGPDAGGFAWQECGRCGAARMRPYQTTR